MAHKLPIYKDVYNEYEFNEETENFKRNIRDVVSKEYKKSYKDREWGELSSFEKNRFLYIQIRGKMLDKMDSSKATRIGKKIDKLVDKNLIDVDVAIREHNAIISQAYEIYYCSTDSIEEMNNNYEKFCCILKLYRERVPIPSFDEWKRRNEISPIRVYDYCQSYYEEARHKIDENIATQKEVDHVILQTILKVLEEKNGIKIDVESIEKTLFYLKNYQIEEDDILTTQEESSQCMSKEENEMLINNDQKYKYYEMKLKNLDFVIKG